MAKNDYLEHLRAVPLFAQCSKRQLEEIAQLTDELSLPNGRVLMREGDLGVELLILMEGHARVERAGVTVAEVGPGHIVGEMAVLSDVPRNATVTATSDVRVLVLTRRSLNQLLDDVPGLAKHLLYEVARRVTATGSQISRE